VLAEHHDLVELEVGERHGVRSGVRREQPAAGAERHLQVPGDRHHRHPEHPVVVEPRDRPGARVAAPDVAVALRQVDVQAQQRVAGGQLRPEPGRAADRTAVDPEPPALPGVQRQVGLPARRHDLRAGQVRVEEPRGVQGQRVRAERHGVVAAAPQRRQHEQLRADAPGDALPHRRDGHRVRRHLQERRVPVGRGGRQRLREAHRPAEVRPPVGDVEGDRRPRVVERRRVDRHRRRPRLDAGDPGRETVEQRVDRRRVRGAAHLERPGLAAQRLDVLDERLELRAVHRAHGQRRRRGVDADRDLREPVRDPRELLAGQLHDGHAAVADPLPLLEQPRAHRHHADAIRGGEGPGDDGGADLAHRVADDGRRLRAVRPPQRRQRDLDAEQRDLRRGDALGGRARGQQLAQREPGLAGDVRLQLVDGRRERRLLRQQPPAHAGPLRADPAEHPHRAGHVRPQVAGARHAGQHRRARRRLLAGREPPQGVRERVPAARGDDGARRLPLAAPRQRVRQVAQRDDGARVRLGQPGGQRAGLGAHPRVVRAGQQQRDGLVTAVL
jgi:hypothetical protein